MDEIVGGEYRSWLDLPVRAVRLNVEVLGPTGHGVSHSRGPSLDANIEVDDPADHDGAQSDNTSLQAEVEHVLNVAPGFDGVVRLEGAAHGFANLQQLQLNVC